MTEFLTGQTAREADKAIKSSLKTMAKAKQCSVLWFDDINERKLYLDLGYSSINQYAEQELGFSTSRTGDYLQLCRSFKKLPTVKAKVKSGELAYTSARVLARVANEKNVDGWVEFAMNNSRRVLEREVKRAKIEANDKSAGQASLLPAQPKTRPAAVVPILVTQSLTPTQFARYEKLWEQIRKHKNAPADKVEALLEILESYAAESSTRVDVAPANKPPVQIHIHQCPECEKATVQTSRGELEIGQAELERAQCDSRISRPNERNTTSIPPKIRRLVLSHARHKCQRPGCNHTHYLEIHHLIPRSKGGTNDPDNCICLCSTCHALHHRQKLIQTGFMVKSPEPFYHWHSQTFEPTPSTTIAIPRCPTDSANSTSTSTNLSHFNPANCSLTTSTSCSHSKFGGPPDFRPNWLFANETRINRPPGERQSATRRCTETINSGGIWAKQSTTKSQRSSSQLELNKSSHRYSRLTPTRAASSKAFRRPTELLSTATTSCPSPAAKTAFRPSPSARNSPRPGESFRNSCPTK
jgi:5-methylcytosine-specific restriction endonuclease McrA